MKQTELISIVQKKKSQNTQIYIYGAGTYGQDIYEVLKNKGIDIVCFLTSKESNKEIKGLKLNRFDEGYVNCHSLFLIGANRLNSTEIYDYLIKAGVNEEQIIKCIDYIENNKGNDVDKTLPTIEITTVMGCAVNCKYCPQSLLLSKYFLNDKNRDKSLSVETFSKCLDHMPEEYNVVFCGMSEPFQNSECIRMIEMACEKAKSVDLYTTLNGVSSNELDRILELPINHVNLHLADKSRNARIIENDEYYIKIKKVINYVRRDRTDFVNVCSSQGEISEELKEIVNGKCIVLTELQDRAGNLSGEGLIKKIHSGGSIKCSFSGKRLNRNVLLPDGTLLLCCMDYGMEHVLGNLRDEYYLDIMQGSEMSRVRKSMEGIGTSLCLNCSMAH